MSKEKSGKRVEYFIIGFLTLVAIAVLVIVFVLNFGAKETHTSAEDDTISIDSLYCNTNDLKDSFFTISDADSVLHEIKVTFKDDKPDLISYKITGTFNNNDLAKKQGDLMLQRLWTYLQDRKLDIYYVENSHSVVDNVAQMDIIGNGNNLYYNTALIFSMETAEALKFEKQTMSSMKKLYTDKGFSCKINK